MGSGREGLENKRRGRNSPKLLWTGFEVNQTPCKKFFIKNVTDLYLSGQTKALLISATGTGKTYAAALAVRHLMNLNTKNEKASPKVRKAPKKYCS